MASSIRSLEEDCLFGSLHDSLASSSRMKASEHVVLRSLPFFRLCFIGAPTLVVAHRYLSKNFIQRFRFVFRCSELCPIGRNYRWAQNPQVLQLRVKAPSSCGFIVSLQVVACLCRCPQTRSQRTSTLTLAEPGFRSGSAALFRMLFFRRSR